MAVKREQHPTLNELRRDVIAAAALLMVIGFGGMIAAWIFEFVKALSG